MTLSFDWSYFWSYYQRINYPQVQEAMKAEVLSDNWLFDQPTEVQISVLKDAPKDFIEDIKARLKPSTLAVIDPQLIDWSKL